jgi:hypothetical protein
MRLTGTIEPKRTTVISKIGMSFVEGHVSRFTNHFEFLNRNPRCRAAS